MSRNTAWGYNVHAHVYICGPGISGWSGLIFFMYMYIGNRYYSGLVCTISPQKLGPQVIDDGRIEVVGFYASTFVSIHVHELMYVYIVYSCICTCTHVFPCINVHIHVQCTLCIPVYKIYNA